MTRTDDSARAGHNARPRQGLRALYAYGVPLLAFAPYLLLTGTRWSWHPDSVLGDWAQYVSHARALLEGRRFADIGYIYHPAAWAIGPQSYPPGFSLTLLPIVAFAGIDSAWFRVLMLVSVLVFACVASWRLRAETAEWQVWVAVGMAAYAIEASGVVVAPMSDPGFCALFWGVIVAVDRPGAWSGGRIALVTALGVAAMAYRIPGVVLIPALGVHALRTWSSHRGRAAVPVVAWCLAGGIAAAMGLVRVPYDVVSAVFSHTTVRLMRTAEELKYGAFEGVLYPFPWDRANDVWHLLALLASVGGLVLLAWRWRNSFLLVAVVAYMTMILAAPVASARYFWPMYPVLTLGLVVGLHRAVTVVSARFATPVTAAAMTVALLGALLVALPQSEPSTLTGSADGRSLFAWVEGQGRREPMRMAFHNPRVLTLYTRVPAMGEVDRSENGQLAAFEDGHVTHVIAVRTAEGGCLQGIVNRLVANTPERFVLVWENATYGVYRLLPRAATEPGPWEAIDWQHAERFCRNRR